MLDYTKVALKNGLNDIKSFVYGFNIFIQLVYIGYLVYALCVGAGLFFANIALISASGAYLIFYAICGRSGRRKLTRRITKRVYKYFKFLMRALTLGATIYGIYVATDKVGITTVLLAVITSVGWFISFVCTLTLEILTLKWRNSRSESELETNNTKRPFAMIGKMFKQLRDDISRLNSGNKKRK